MKAEHNTVIRVQRLRNRFILVRKRIIRKNKYINDNIELMHPTRKERWEKAIARDLKELKLLEQWMDKAEKYGQIIWYDKRSALDINTSI